MSSLLSSPSHTLYLLPDLFFFAVLCRLEAGCRSQDMDRRSNDRPLYPRRVHILEGVLSGIVNTRDVTCCYATSSLLVLRRLDAYCLPSALR